MSQTLHLVDAFTNHPFAGNPAAVCVLEQPADEHWMKLVAREMNLSETAFLHPIEGGFSLRWLTPTVEVKLCGHATLASAFTLWETGRLAPDEPARFHTLSGWLTCRRNGEWIEMVFPSLPVVEAEPPPALLEGLGFGSASPATSMPLFVGNAGFKWLVELADETAVRAARPDFQRLGALPVQGIIITARSDAPEFDFVSRYFAPASGVNEDPVTGSAHCALGPYWQSKLGKADFTAYQASERGGTVKLSVQGERVLLQGQAVMMGRCELMQVS
jgi:PhzF family phenazine biosynthesis protein